MTLIPKITYTNTFVGLRNNRPIAMKSFFFNQGILGMQPDYTVRNFTYWMKRCQICDHGEVVPHNHDFYEIAVILGGSAEHYTNDKKEYVHRGTVLVIPPGECHGFNELKGLTKINLYYISEWLADDLQLLWRQEALVPLFLGHILFQQHLHQPTYSFECEEMLFLEIVNELQAIQDELDSNSPSLVYLQAAFLKVLVRMSQAYTQMYPDWNDGYGIVRKEVTYVLREVEECIDGNRKFDMQDVASRLSLSQEYVCRLFKTATGRPPMEYYQYRRIQQGARRLLSPETSVTDIAHELGFCDTSHFSRQFRKYMGKEPREYRKMFQRTEASTELLPMDL